MTCSVPLTQGLFALVDDDDFERTTALKWFAYFNGRTWYAARTIQVNKKRFLIPMHRFILGFGPEDPHVDHEDGDGLNNCRQNLRPATRSQNMCNRRKNRNASSRFKGVHWDSYRNGAWVASIRINGRQRKLGRFQVEADAARAYDVAARGLHGEFARVNFPMPQEQAA